MKANKMKYKNLINGMLFLTSICSLIIIYITMTAFAADQSQNKIINHTPAIISSAKIIDVHDGDTVTVLVQKQLKIRLLDCWSPELSQPEGISAKNYLQSILKNDDEIMVEIPLTTDVSKSLTFGRFLGFIYKDINGDGQEENISNEMVKAGHATKTKQITK